jgi:hypothetical protein
MGILDTILLKHAAKKTDGLSWPQVIDLACSMLGITARSIKIDSARACVHVSFTQLGKSHLMDVPFKEIMEAINAPVGSHTTPQAPKRVYPGIGPVQVSIGTADPVKACSATAPP